MSNNVKQVNLSLSRIRPNAKKAQGTVEV